jgi:sulfur relay protein TusB/DsrH
MSTLITINRSWHAEPWLYEKRFLASAGDAILLIEDAVLSLQSPLALASFLAKCRAEQVTVIALERDVLGRGVNNAYEDIDLICDAEFVAQVVKHDKQLAW